MLIIINNNKVAAATCVKAAGCDVGKFVSLKADFNGKQLSRLKAASNVGPKTIPIFKEKPYFWQLS